MLKLTDRAVEKIKQLMAKENKQGHGLRVAVQGGGCSGFQYGLSYEKSRAEGDQVYEFGGLSVFVDPRSHPLLDAVTIDPFASVFGWALANELVATDDDERIRLTTRGRLLSNEVFARLV